jgi:hypothetical protein
MEYLKINSRKKTILKVINSIVSVRDFSFLFSFLSRFWLSFYSFSDNLTTLEISLEK